MKLIIVEKLLNDFIQTQIFKLKYPKQNSISANNLIFNQKVRR